MSSVHATDPALRSRLLVNERAGQILDQIAWFQDKRLQIHAQVVVCPGLNDGDALVQTLQDLARFGGGDWPAVLSVAVVPVGLTRFRPDGDGLVPVTPAMAKRTIELVEPLQQQFAGRFGSRWAWLSDEWYLMAGLPLPQRASYEDLPQQENGVGSIRAFLEQLDDATQELPAALTQAAQLELGGGSLVGPSLKPVVERLRQVQGLDLRLQSLPSPYWGCEQVVTGLLTGQDLIDGLQGKDLGEAVLLPAVLLRQGQPVFLDDLSLQNVEQRLGVPSAGGGGCG